MEAYEGLAALYDELMDDFDYDGWAEYYLALVRRFGVRPETLCDLACGTGSLSIPFARSGLRVTGIDISEEMLRRASEKARRAGERILFSQQDIADFSVGRRVDCAICGCDGVNYLTEDGQLEGFFASAHAALKPGGVLAFDISSPYKYARMKAERAYCEERDDVAWLWFNSFDEARPLVTMELSFFQRTSNDLYRRFSERHVQRVYQPQELKSQLERAGFASVEILGDRTFDAPGDAEKRIHIAAIRR